MKRIGNDTFQCNRAKICRIKDLMILEQGLKSFAFAAKIIDGLFDEICEVHYQLRVVVSGFVNQEFSVIEKLVVSFL